MLKLIKFFLNILLKKKKEKKDEKKLLAHLIQRDNRSKTSWRHVKSIVKYEWISECLQLSEHTSVCTYVKKEALHEKKGERWKNLVDCQKYRHSDWDLIFTSQRFRGPLHVIIKSLQKIKSLSEFCRQVSTYCVQRESWMQSVGATFESIFARYRYLAT